MLRILAGVVLSFHAYCMETIPLTALSSDASMRLNLSSPIGVPVQSKATVGSVKRQQISSELFNTPLFIVGADARSINWMENHLEELQEKQALGLITNVGDFETVIRLQQRFQLPLLPVNVDPLLQYLNETHYPFIIAEGALWQ